MKNVRRGCMALLLTAALSGISLSQEGLMTPAYAATEVAVIVNGNAITNYDIQRRAAFLRLQQRKGNLNALAKDELTEEMLKRIEMKTRNINVSDAEVNQAFAGFAQRNKMTVAQLSAMLNQAGVTPEHFKTYIQVQMGWGRLLQARYHAENGGSSGLIPIEKAVQRMLKNGGVKPSANEYTMQQVIFVIPANKRGVLMGSRKQAANFLRTNFTGCQNLKSLVNETRSKFKVDVAPPKPLNRIIEQQLPPEWEKAVKATPAGKMTAPQETERGVEVLAVCEIRKVSDDKVAQLVFSIEDSQGNGGDKKIEDLNTKYLGELRAKARIETP